MERTVVTRRLLKRLRRRTLHGILVEQPAAEPLPAQEHVLHDVEVVGQRQVLVHRLDAEAGRVPGVADVHRTTLEEDLPVVGLVHTGDAAGQHRLAGTVVPAEPGDLAGGQIQVHLVQRLDRAEVLVDAPQLQERLRPLPTSPPRRSPGVVVHLSRLRSMKSSEAVRDGPVLPRRSGTAIPSSLPVATSSARASGMSGRAAPRDDPAAPLIAGIRRGMPVRSTTRFRPRCTPPRRRWRRSRMRDRSRP